MATTQSSGLDVRGEHAFKGARRVSRHAVDESTYPDIGNDQERFYIVEIHKADRHHGDATLGEDHPNHAEWTSELVAVYASADGGRAVRRHADSDEQLPHAIAVDAGAGTVVEDATARRWHGVVATAHDNKGWKLTETITNIVREVL